MNVEEILEKTFLDEWSVLSDANIRPFMVEIKKSFALDRVEKYIEEELTGASDKHFWERYHQQNLRVLARLYANTLYNLSDQGENLNSDIINETKYAIKIKKECETYPC